MGQNFFGGLAGAGAQLSQQTQQYQLQRQQVEELRRQEQVQRGRIAKQQALQEIGYLRQQASSLSPEERQTAGADKAIADFYAILTAPDENAAGMLDMAIRPPAPPSIGDVGGPNRQQGLPGWVMQQGQLTKQPVPVPGYPGVLGRVDQLLAQKTQTAKVEGIQEKDDEIAFAEYRAAIPRATANIQAQLRELGSIPSDALTDTDRTTIKNLEQNLRALSQSTRSRQEWLLADRPQIDESNLAGDVTLMIQGARTRAQRSAEEKELATRTTAANAKQLGGKAGRAYATLDGLMKELSGVDESLLSDADKGLMAELSTEASRLNNLIDVGEDTFKGLSPADRTIDIGSLLQRANALKQTVVRKAGAAKKSEVQLAQSAQGLQQQAKLAWADATKTLEDIGNISDAYLTDEDKQVLADLQKQKARLGTLTGVTDEGYKTLDDTGKSTDIASLLERANLIKQKAVRLKETEAKADEAAKVNRAIQFRDEDIARDGLNKSWENWQAANRTEIALLAEQRKTLEGLPKELRPANYSETLTRIDSEIAVRSDNLKLTPEQYKAGEGKAGDLKGALVAGGVVQGDIATAQFKYQKAGQSYQGVVREATGNVGNLEQLLNRLNSIPDQQKPAGWKDAVSQVNAALEVEKGLAYRTSLDDYAAGKVPASTYGTAKQVAEGVINQTLGIVQQQGIEKEDLAKKEARAENLAQNAQAWVNEFRKTPDWSRLTPTQQNELLQESMKVGSDPNRALEDVGGGMNRAQALMSKVISLQGGDPTLAAVMSMPAPERYAQLESKKWVVTDEADPNVGQLNEEGKKAFGNLANLAGFSTGYNQAQDEKAKPMQGQLQQFLLSPAGAYLNRVDRAAYQRMQTAANSGGTPREMQELLGVAQQASIDAVGQARIDQLVEAGVEITDKEIKDLRSDDPAIYNKALDAVEDRLRQLPATKRTEATSQWLVSRFDEQLTTLSPFLDSDARADADLIISDPSKTFAQKAEALQEFKSDPRWLQAMSEQEKLGDAQTKEFFRKLKSGQTEEAFGRAEIMAKAYGPDSKELNSYAQTLIAEGTDPKVANAAQALAIAQSQAIREGKEVDGVRLGLTLAESLTPQQIDALAKKSPGIAKLLGVNVQIAKEQAGRKQNLIALGMSNQLADMYNTPTNVIGKDGRVLGKEQFVAAVDAKMLALKKEMAASLGIKDLADPRITRLVQRVRAAEEASYGASLARQAQQDKENQYRDTSIGMQQQGLQLQKEEFGYRKQTDQRNFQYQVGQDVAAAERDERNFGYQVGQAKAAEARDTRDYNLRVAQWEDSKDYRDAQTAIDEEKWAWQKSQSAAEWEWRRTQAKKEGSKQELAVLKEQAQLYSSDYRNISSEIRSIDSQITKLSAAGFLAPEQQGQLSELKGVREQLVARQGEVRKDLNAVQKEYSDYAKAQGIPAVRYDAPETQVGPAPYAISPEAARVLYDRMAREPQFAKQVNALVEYGQAKIAGTAEVEPEKAKAARAAMAVLGNEGWAPAVIDSFISGFDPNRVPQRQPRGASTGINFPFYSVPSPDAGPVSIFTGGSPTQFNLSELVGVKTLKTPVQGVQVVATPAGQKAALVIANPAQAQNLGVQNSKYCARFVRLCLADGSKEEKQVAGLFVTGVQPGNQQPTALMSETKFRGLTDGKTGFIKGTDKAIGGQVQAFGGPTKLIPGDVVFASKSDPQGHVGLIVAGKDGQLYVSENTTAPNGPVNRLTPLNDFMARPGGITYVVRPDAYKLPGYK